MKENPYHHSWKGCPAHAWNEGYNQAIEDYRIGIGQSYIKWTDEEIVELMDIGRALRKKED